MVADPSCRRRRRLRGGPGCLRDPAKLLDRGKIKEACEKLESSYRIDEALGTLLNLASCHEKQGRLATAWGEYNEGLSIAKKAGQATRQKFAREHAAAIEPRLAHLTVLVEASARVEGLEVSVDKVVLASGAWTTPVPVDPGEHLIAATAPGRTRWEQRSALKEAESITVAVPTLASSPTLTQIPGSTPAPAAPPPARSAWKLRVGIAALGLGAVGLGVGAVFGSRAFSLAATSNQGCKPDGSCSPAGYQAYLSGRSAATNADVLIGVGVGAASVGAVLLILDALDRRATAASTTTGRSKPRRRLTAMPVLAPGLGLAAIGGDF